MRKFFIFGFVSIFTIAFAENEVIDSLKTKQLEEIIISATRAGEKTPITYSDISASEIRKDNAANNLPVILQMLPSVVVSTENGTGVGNTLMRIRGTDATRINVTLNGMPLNNPETQEVYWVNLPDLSNSLQSIQLQRGVGTSTNGSAAFGASLSLKTIGGQSKAYGEFANAIGSYNTFSSNMAAGTGILENGLSIDARFSKILSDGYVRNGKVNHQNLYVSLSHYTDEQLIRLLYLRGEQHTGITWEGVSKEQMQDKEYGRRYNPSGEYFDDAGNRLYYDNETDNYFSDILQLLFSRKISSSLSANAAVSWNHGMGYYENYKRLDPIFGKKFDYYGLINQTIDGISYKRSDLIKQERMLNDFYVANLGIDYRKNKLNWNLGAMYSYYDGDHFGRLPWVKFNENIPTDFEWYRNNGIKTEVNLFTKAEYLLFENLSVFADAQFRSILYKFSGMDKDRRDTREMKGNLPYNFFNPKVGVFYSITENHNLYTSIALGQREPLRTDLKDGVKGDLDKLIKPEKMIDYEIGYRYKNESGLSSGINFYFMDYDNQMVQTGRLSDIGYKILENVKDSYRTGIELEFFLPMWNNKLQLSANATFSKNKIKNYTAYYDVYDNLNDYNGVMNGASQLQNEVIFKTTNISFSPEIVSGINLTYQPNTHFYVSLLGKYVGKQYLDNTSDDEKSLPSYFTSNFLANYTFSKLGNGEVSLQLFVNNIFNKEYIANGWAATDAFSDGSVIHYIGYYPQATRNVMTRVILKF